MSAAQQTVYCSKGHMGRYTDHGPMVGRGWFCPDCKDDIPHVDNVFGAAAKLKLASKPIEVQVIYPKRGDKLNCVKMPCKACSGVSRKLPLYQVKPGDSVTCWNNKGIADVLENGVAYEVVATTPKGLVIRFIKGGKWVEQEYSRCRFMWGK